MQTLLVQCQWFCENKTTILTRAPHFFNKLKEVIYIFTHTEINKLGKAGIDFQEAISGVEIVETDKLEIEYLQSREAQNLLSEKESEKLDLFLSERRAMNWTPRPSGIEICSDTRSIYEDNVYDGEEERKPTPIFLNHGDKVVFSQGIEVKRSKDGNKLLLIDGYSTLLAGCGKKGLYLMLI